jgi:hypothetical protein
VLQQGQHIAVELLDSPRFVVKTEQAFALLTTLYFLITGRHFPVQPFFKLWRYPRGQLSFLIFAIYSTQPPEVFNFTADVGNRAPIEVIVVHPAVRHIIDALSSLNLQRSSLSCQLVSTIQQSATSCLKKPSTSPTSS